MTWSASSAPEGCHRLSSTFLSTCEILVTLWLVCHCSIPTKISNVLLLEWKASMSLLKEIKDRYCQVSEKDPEQSVHLKCVCTYLSFLPKNLIFQLALVNQQLGCQTWKEMAAECTLIALGPVSWEQLAKLRSREKMKEGILQMRQDMPWRSCLVSCNGTEQC